MNTNYTIRVTILMLIPLLFTHCICSSELGYTVRGEGHQKNEQLLMKAKKFKKRGTVICLASLAIALSCVGLHAMNVDGAALFFTMLTASCVTMVSGFIAIIGSVEERRLEKERHAHNVYNTL